MKAGSQNKKFIYLLLMLVFLLSKNLNAENIMGYQVTLGALDKITAKFSEFDVEVDKSANFGSLEIKIFSCYKRPPEEIPEDFVLMKISDNINIENPLTIFYGWMLSSSPSISPLEHPIYDIWVKDCKIKN